MSAHLPWALLLAAAAGEHGGEESVSEMVIHHISNADLADPGPQRRDAMGPPPATPRLSRIDAAGPPRSRADAHAAATQLASQNTAPASGSKMDCLHSKFCRNADGMTIHVFIQCNDI